MIKKFEEKLCAIKTLNDKSFDKKFVIKKSGGALTCLQFVNMENIKHLTCDFVSVSNDNIYLI